MALLIEVYTLNNAVLLLSNEQIKHFDITQDNSLSIHNDMYINVHLTCAQYGFLAKCVFTNK